MSDIASVISFGYAKYKICICELLDAYNFSQRNPGPPPGFGGIEGDFLQILVNGLGTSFDYISFDHFGTGVNGMASGCEGLMQRSQVDVIVCPTFIDIGNSGYGEPSVSFNQEENRFISKRPDLVPKYDALLKVFDRTTFVSIGVTLLLMSLAFYLITNRRESYVSHVISRFADLVLQEPLVKIGNTLPAKILTTFWILGAQFITLSFMAVILTSLMIPKYKPPVDDHEKLLKAIRAKEYRAATFIYLPNHLAMGMDESPSKTLNEIGRYIRQNDMQLWLDETNYVRVLENYTTIATSSFFRHLFIPDNYPIVIFEEEFQVPSRMCIIIHRSFPFRKKLRAIVQSVVEYGFYQRNFENHIFKFRLKNFWNFERKNDMEWKPLTLESLQGAFIMLGAGLACSLIVFILELLSDKIKFKQRVNITPKRRGISKSKRKGISTSKN